MARIVLRSVVRNLCNSKQVVRSNPVHTQRFLNSVSRSSFDRGLLANNCKVLSPISKSLHTTADTVLAGYLKDEIKNEKGMEKILEMKIKDFEVEKCDGPNVVLVRSFNGEKLTIKFNINDSVEDVISNPEQDQQDNEEGQDVQLFSRPSFIFEVDKGGDEILAVNCSFPSTEQECDDNIQDEFYDEVIKIEELTISKKSQEWDDKVYCMSGTVMDGNIYDMILKMMEERGVDSDFMNQLEEWSTTHEHQRYVELLHNLKTFVSK